MRFGAGTRGLPLRHYFHSAGVIRAIRVGSSTYSAPSVLAIIEFAGGRFIGEALRVAVTVAPTRGKRLGVLAERIVVGHAAVVENPMHLAHRHAEVLGIRARPALADGEEQIARLV